DRRASRTASPADPGSSSASGTMSGGSLTSWTFPSTRVVSLAKARRLSFVLAFSTPAWNRFTAFRLDSARQRLMMSRYMWEYQTAGSAHRHPDAGCRGGGQVGRHDEGRSPVEGEGRREHAPIADRHEVRHASRCLLLEERDRISWGRVVLRMALARDSHAGVL